MGIALYHWHGLGVYTFRFSLDAVPAFSLFSAFFSLDSNATWFHIHGQRNESHAVCILIPTTRNRMKTHQFVGIQSEIQIERKTLCPFIYSAFIFISINSSDIHDAKIFSSQFTSMAKWLWEIFSLFLFFSVFSSIFSFKTTEMRCKIHWTILADLEVAVKQSLFQCIFNANRTTSRMMTLRLREELEQLRRTWADFLTH